MKPCMVVILALLLGCAISLSQTHRTISYQGLLCDAAGQPRPDAWYTVTFRLYDVETGGTALWTEERSTYTTRGLFSLRLGKYVPFGATVTFDRSYWLGIQVGSEAELSPRIPLTTAPYSFTAAKADTANYAASVSDGAVSTSTIMDGAVTGAKVATGQVVKSLSGLRDDILLRAGTNVSIGKSGSTLTISATGGGNDSGDNLGNHTATQNLNLNSHWLSGNGSDMGLFVNGSGNVGIGTNSPTAGLHLLGGVTSTLFMQTTPWSSTDNYAELRLGDDQHYVRGQWGRGMTFYDHDRFLFLNAPVGIHTSSPSADLHVAGVNGVLFEGTFNSGTIPIEGTGTRMMWYPKKAAFRAGTADGTPWDDANIGQYSIAMGYSPKASGPGSIALGSVAEASGYGSTAIGMRVVASGGVSTAMGHTVSTNSFEGAFIIGDAYNEEPVASSAANQFMAVFSGGYMLYTSRLKNSGVYMNGWTSGWTNICDRNKKENFRGIDGEELLSKIRSMSITEWNYKESDPSIKYIGPVAQDFYAAFHLGGKDSLGINSICIDGVNMAAVQALEIRTAELREKTVELYAMTAKLEAAVARAAALETRLSRLEKMFAAQRDLTQLTTPADEVNLSQR
jgi:hypothetical protein